MQDNEKEAAVRVTEGRKKNRAGLRRATVLLHF
jgi:hypothetical protein